MLSYVLRRSHLFLWLISSIILFIAIAITASQGNFSAYAITTPSNALPDISFASVGDWGCTPNSINTLQNIIATNPQLVLTLGDLSYHDTADCWLKMVAPINEKIKIVFGNHDNQTSALLNQYMSNFALTKQFYSFNYKYVHFTVMSTDLPYGRGSEQYNFVVKDLTNAAANPNIHWIIVMFHKLAYTSKSVLLAIPALAETYHPLFEKYHVDLVLEGHQHNYQRSYPININKTASNPFMAVPIITSKNTNNYTNPQGQIFIIVGTGGESLFPLREKAAFIDTQYLGYGFLNIFIRNNGTILSAKFHANDGTIKDAFTIRKSTTQTNSVKQPSPSSLHLNQSSNLGIGVGHANSSSQATKDPITNVIPGKNSSKFTVSDFGALSNDGVDDIRSFRDALKFAANSTHIIHIPSGIYDLSGQINIPDNMVIAGDNQNNTIIVKYTNLTHFDTFRATNKANITVSNLTIRGSGIDTSGDCIHFVNVTGYAIGNTKLSGCGSGLDGSAIYTRSTSDGKILHNIIYNVRNGMIIGGHHIQILFNTIESKPFGIRITPLSDNVLIKDNNLKNCGCIIKKESLGRNIIIQQR